VELGAVALDVVVGVALFTTAVVVLVPFVLVEFLELPSAGCAIATPANRKAAAIAAVAPIARTKCRVDSFVLACICVIPR
jgi:hypothetical protein